jgi:hypothetical protein
LRSLQDKFDELEGLLLHHRSDLGQHSGVPFIRLVHRPDEEVACQRFRAALARTLRREKVAVETVSCRTAMFDYYERRGLLEDLYALERAGDEQLADHIAQRGHESLTAELLAAARRLPGDGVILLVDVAFLYPYLHLGGVLDACTNAIVPPVAMVVFYPAEIDVDRGLLFLGKRPSGYYRMRDLI